MSEMEEEKTLTELRRELALERLRQIPREEETKEAFRPFFAAAANWLLLLDDESLFLEGLQAGTGEWSALVPHNHALYEDILPENYGRSFANPAYACEALGRELGPFMAALFYELRGCIPFVYRGETERLLIRMELLLEIYTAFTAAYREEGETPSRGILREIMSLYLCDYAQEEEERRLAGLLDPEQACLIVSPAGKDGAGRFAPYCYGEYIPETEAVRVAAEVLRVQEANGLLPLREQTLFVPPGSSEYGWMGTLPNPQYVSDHREDLALFLDPLFLHRKLEGIREARQACRGLIRQYAPVFLTSAGETGEAQKQEPPLPPKAAAAPSFTARQRRLLAELEAAGALPGQEFAV